MQVDSGLAAHFEVRDEFDGGGVTIFDPAKTRRGGFTRVPAPAARGGGTVAAARAAHAPSGISTIARPIRPWPTNWPIDATAACTSAIAARKAVAGDFAESGALL